MKLTYVPVKIARSITLLVTSPVESSLRAQTAGWLLRRAQEAEAVVFVEWDGDVPRLETAGGELSVDGAMALTAWLALDNGVPMGETWDFPLALNGGALSLPCAVTPVNTCCVVTVTMPRAEVTGTFPEPYLQEVNGLLDEMEKRETPEAKLYKALDRLEALIAHNEADIATWLPLEYDLQYTYGKDDMRFSPVLMKLREEVDRVTTEKIRDAKHGV